MNLFSTFNRNHHQQPLIKRYNSANNQKEDNLHITHKSQKTNDFVSVIEQVGDSVLSGDELLKQFQQYGIQIENIQGNDDSFDYKLKISDKNAFLDPASSRRKSDTSDHILDYSKIAKQKQKDYIKSDSHVKMTKCLNNIKFIMDFVKKQKTQILESKIQIQKQTLKFRNDMQKFICLSQQALIDKIASIRNTQLQQKQQLKLKIKTLEETLQKSIIQKSQMKQQKKAFEEQLRMVKSQKQGKLRQSTAFTSKHLSTELDYLKQSRKFNNQLEFQFRRQTQILKNLNAQINQLTNQLEQVKYQNKKLKQQIKQSDKRAIQKVNVTRGQINEKNIENYNRFLQKIKLLEQEIHQLRLKQSQEKQQQVREWKKQIQQQVEQMQQFLAFCEQKQKQLLIRQRDVQKREYQLRKQIQIKRRQSYMPDIQDQENVEQVRQNMREQRFPNKKGSPLKTSQGPIGTKLTKTKIPPPSYISQRVLKTSPSKHYDFVLNRKSMSSKPDLHQRPSFGNTYKGQTKFTTQLNCRLNKISSSIQSQLNSLGFHH